MSKASLEEQLDQLRAMRAASDKPIDKEALAARLRPFLRHANNLVVAKAADLAREDDLHALLEEIVTAFRRFLDAPAKKDQQCWAKNALSKAMHHLGCDDVALFLAGLRLHQYEPVWGGQSDVAGTLRANCAHALIDCHALSHQALLLHLLEIVADKDKSVRAEAMRAIAQAGGDNAALLLRLRALTADEKEDPAVIGQCYAGLLALEGSAAVPFVANFLADQDDLSAEAAVALGETRTPEAAAALLARLHPAAGPHEASAPSRAGRRSFLSGAFLEPSFAASLLSAIALTRQPEAIEALLALVEKESSYAEEAIQALANAGYGNDVQERLEAIVTRIDNSRLTLAFQQNFRA